MIRILVPLVLIVLLSCSSREYFLVTGTYTNTGSKGIYVHTFETGTAATTLIDSFESSNPSFLRVSRDGNYLYVVNENASSTVGGAVSSFSFNNQTGKLDLVNQQASLGDHPCHLSLDNTGKWLMVANYSGGSIAAFAIQPNGKIDTAYQYIQLTGKSKDPKRQQSAHAHQVVFSPGNKFLYVTDLGSDKIMIYSFDEKNGRILPASPAFVTVDAGAGPRHLIFHSGKNFAYLLAELTGAVSTYSFDPGTGMLQREATISTVPDGFSGFAGSAEVLLSPDGNYLYASNRGTSNTIATFRIDPLTGSPVLKQIDSTLGKAPRHFSIHPTGKYLLVGNMDSDEIVIFNRNLSTGLISNTGKRIYVKKPVCLMWVEKKK